MRGWDKLVGIGFLFIASGLYMSHYVAVAIMYPNKGMKYAMKTFGMAPRYWAIAALVLGGFYLVKAEWPFLRRWHRKFMQFRREIMEADLSKRR